MPASTVDRRRLVRRHNPVLTAAHPTAALTIGNGDAALTVDITGLQTFPDAHELVPDPHRVAVAGIDGLPEQRVRVFDADDFQIPLRTQSSWGWYRTRTTREFDRDETVTRYDTARGAVPYLDRMGLQRAGDEIADEFAAGAWFHYNPRRAHLGRLALTPPVGRPDRIDVTAVRDPRTELDLWSGRVHAQFVLEGESVTVTTVAHPEKDVFAVSVESPLLQHGWGVAWIFDTQPDDFATFELPLEESTQWERRTPGHWTGRRRIETTAYRVDVSTNGGLALGGADATVATSDGERLEVVVSLHADDSADDLRQPTYGQVARAAETWWEGYWSSGVAVSFEGSDDERATELERRVVLSQYLAAVNSAGSTPPAETGLTYNTWTGKFHLEMHWWHAAHFALWGRGHLLERSLGWYHSALDAARSTAEWQGYRGARWPKQTDPSAAESPSNIGVFLVWQQPHIIHLLELLRQEGRGSEFLRTHYPLVEATAEFMADFVEERDGAFHLPPPIIPAQESYLADRRTNADPTFELAYWSWALEVANEWRSQLGLGVQPEWERVAQNMTMPTLLDDGTYAALSTPPHLIRKDHPSMLMGLGWLPPTDIIDADIMSETLDAVWDRWDLQSSWGWDYPVMAMTAARLGDLALAFDALLLPSPKNEFLANGHNPQIPGFLSLYLPANGGLLSAIAHIVGAIRAGDREPDGWRVTYDGAPSPSPSPSPSHAAAAAV
ncbi:hypothetical protein [Microbacterium phyllosphaerae]|uniref:hypothetical protein n=1 Tax=Microbacterium phyllosphaerae TaxID=124798 RepID=UPI0021696C69|nr:hypothetical protein [Microbacterium phyllosphaerae]MCS3442493.1 hypothetical protein [Microbacterium phyllosphaerae]